MSNALSSVFLLYYENVFVYGDAFIPIISFLTSLLSILYRFKNFSYFSVISFRPALSHLWKNFLLQKWVLVTFVITIRLREGE